MYREIEIGKMEETRDLPLLLEDSAYWVFADSDA